MDEQVLTIWNRYVITKGMIVLWTLGGIFHSIFDVCIWNIMACACCHPGGRWGDSDMAPRCKDCGSYMLVPVVLGLMALAVCLVLARVTIEADDADGANTEGQDGWDFSDTNVDSVEGVQSFSFLSDYCVELALAWFVWFPVVGTLLFSGILGCNGRLPILGGRPRDKRLIEEEFSSSRRESGQRYAI